MTTCLIIEDDFPAQRLLERYISQTPRLRLLGSYENAFSAQAAILESRPRLLFLDLALPGSSGFELLDELPAAFRPKVIFTTAQEPSAQQVFAYEVIDFLKKPFSYERFLKAVQKIPPAETELEPFLIRDVLTREGHAYAKVIPQEILFIESLDKYVKIHLQQGSFLMAHRPLKSFEDQFPPTHFLRVHRSFIVNVSAIDKIHKKEIYLKDAQGQLTSIPIGESYQKAFESWLGLYFPDFSLTNSRNL